jgi:hypothetical protein
MAQPSRNEMLEVADSTGDAGMGFGPSKWPGMTYEEGVRSALMWAAGDGDNPMEDED